MDKKTPIGNFSLKKEAINCRRMEGTKVQLIATMNMNAKEEPNNLSCDQISLSNPQKTLTR
jgi:hypothetical protein